MSKIITVYLIRIDEFDAIGFFRKKKDAKKFAKFLEEREKK